MKDSARLITGESPTARSSWIRIPLFGWLDGVAFFSTAHQAGFLAVVVVPPICTGGGGHHSVQRAVEQQRE